MGTSGWSWRRAAKRRSQARYVVFSGLLVVGLIYIAFNGVKEGGTLEGQGRRLLQEGTAAESESSLRDDYPRDLFTDEQLSQGAVILHFIGMLYMFLALAIVCDEFFVPSLECITKTLKIKDDVAGATFMAAGGSAPELATSLIGVFTESSVGFGTVVGSAVFNVLFVIGMCSIFSKEVLTLTWWPLTRDVTFYSIALGLLAWVFSDEQIQIWEASILIFVYICYVTFMAYNEQAQEFVLGMLKKMGIIKEEDADIFIKTASGGFVKARQLWKVSIYSAMAHAEKQKSTIEKASGKSKFQQLGKAIIMDGRFKKMRAEVQDTSGAMDAFKIKEPPKPEGDSRKLEHNISFQANIVEHALRPDQYQPDYTKPLVDPAQEGNSANDGGKEPIDPTPSEPAVDNGEDDEPLDLSFPDTFWAQVFYIISLPLLFLLVYTIPDTRRPACKKWFLLSFILSIVWIGAFSYLMVWWATVIGVVAGIPEVVMGLTFLAAGTSVPDLLTSVIVARQGQGDMAVSSSIGSNLFDVCIGLPVPWFLYSCAFGFKAVAVQSDSLLLSVLILFGMLIAVIVTIALSKWKMTKCMGITMFSLYALFLTQALIIEFMGIKVGI